MSAGVQETSLSSAVSAGQPRQRVDWVDYAKGIGIFLVVVGHVLRGLDGDAMLEGRTWFPVVDNWIYAFHMPLFFFLSGLFATRAVRESPSTFLVKRLKGVAYPYFVWILIIGVTRSVAYDGVDAGVSFLTGYWRILFDPYDIFWFLYALFLISVVYYGMRKMGLSALVSLAVLVVLNLVFEIADLDLAWRPANYFCLYAPYFAVGALFMDKGWAARLNEMPTVLKSSLVAFGLGLLLVWSLRDALVAGSPVLWAASLGIVAVILIALQFQTLGSPDFVRRWGNLSLQIYVAHTLVGAVVRLALVKMGVESVVLHVVAGVILGLYIPILIYEVGNRIGFPYLYSLKR